MQPGLPPHPPPHASPTSLHPQGPTAVQSPCLCPAGETLRCRHTGGKSLRGELQSPRVVLRVGWGRPHQGAVIYSSTCPVYVCRPIHMSVYMSGELPTKGRLRVALLCGQGRRFFGQRNGLSLGFGQSCVD